MCGQPHFRRDLGVGWQVRGFVQSRVRRDPLEAIRSAAVRKRIACHFARQAVIRSTCDSVCAYVNAYSSDKESRIQRVIGIDVPGGPDIAVGEVVEVARTAICHGPWLVA